MLAADEEVSNDHETLPGMRGSEERERRESERKWTHREQGSDKGLT